MSMLPDRSNAAIVAAATQLTTSAAELSGAAGLVTYPAAAAPANGVSLAEVLREMYNQMDKSIKTGTAVIANGTQTIFTVAGGPILILNLGAICVTDNDTTATLLKYTCDPTDGAATDISAASASLASKVAGCGLNITGTVANATVITAAGTAIDQLGKIICPAGVIQQISTTGPTSGTWFHYLRYRPLCQGVTVTAAF